MNYTLADVPDDLLKRAAVDHHDLKRAIAMTRWIEDNCAHRPTFWEIHLLRVERGFERPYSRRDGLDRLRKRRDDKRKAEGPRGRPSQAARSAARGQAAA